MKTYYYFKVKGTKIGSEKLQRQVNLACMRIKNKTGYTGGFTVQTGLSDNDFVNDRITLVIKKHDLL